MSTSRFDPRFSSPGAHATPWPAVETVLVGAELYWLTTVRADGLPHDTGARRRCPTRAAR